MTYPGSTLFPGSLTFPATTPPPPPHDGTIWAIDWFTGYEGMFPVPDDLGCLWIVTNVEGWQGLAAPRVVSTDRPVNDGTIDGLVTQPGRTITIEGTVRAPDLLTLHAAMDRASGLLMDGSRYAVLEADEAHMTRRTAVRRGAEAIVIPSRSAQREATFSFVFYAPDPRRFGDPMSGTATLPKVSGGLAIPFAIPFSLDSVVNSGTVTLVNAGTTAGPVSLRIDGPCQGPVVTHRTSDTALVFAASMVLAAGEFITVDMERHEVLANGQPTAPRNNYVTSRGWSGFDPGENEWVLGATTYNPLMKLTVTAFPAW